MSHDSDSDAPQPIVVVDVDLHESRHEVRQNATGKQIVEAAGKQPADDYFVLYRPPAGGLKELSGSEATTVGPQGISRFYVIKGDRLFRFEIDDVMYEWPISPIQGAVLYAIAAANPETTAIWTEGGDTAPRTIAIDDLVEFGKPGVEKFRMKPREPKHPKIFINDKAYEVKQDHLNGAQIKALGGIETDYQLFLEQPGDDLAISNEKSVKIVDQMRFYSLPPAVFG